MPSTHLSLHYHIVFAIKARARLIARGWRDDMHGCLGGIICKLGGMPEAIGGVEDHLRRNTWSSSAGAWSNTMNVIYGDAS